MRRSARRLLPWLFPAIVVLALVGLLNGPSGLLGDPSRHFELGSLGSVQLILNSNATALTSLMSVLTALVLLSV